MNKLILFLLFAFSLNCLAQDLPIVKFPNKKEIDKAIIKELIKELDANSKEELLKEDQQKKNQKKVQKKNQSLFRKLLPIHLPPNCIMHQQLTSLSIQQSQLIIKNHQLDQKHTVLLDQSRTEAFGRR